MGECAVLGCDTKVTAQGLCQVHYLEKRNYGLEPDRYTALFADGCSNVECVSVERLRIDVDPARGVLCVTCSRALDHSEGEADRLRGLASYLDWVNLS